MTKEITPQEVGEWIKANKCKKITGEDITKFECSICRDDCRAEEDRDFNEGKWEELYDDIDYIICKDHSKERIKKYKKKYPGSLEKSKNLKKLWDRDYKLFETDNFIIYKATITGRIFRIKKMNQEERIKKLHEEFKKLQEEMHPIDFYHQVFRYIGNRVCGNIEGRCNIIFNKKRGWYKTYGGNVNSGKWKIK